MKEDKLVLGGHEFDSRFILGSGKYNVELIDAAVKYAGAQGSCSSLYRFPVCQNDTITQ